MQQPSRGPTRETVRDIVLDNIVSDNDDELVNSNEEWKHGFSAAASVCSYTLIL